MSRIAVTKANGNQVAFGLDHAIGWFYQEYDADGEMVNDTDTMFGGLSRGTLLELLEDTDATDEQKFAIALDLDPGA
jgi:hypothetical protein